jgi:hypothetical protein
MVSNYDDPPNNVADCVASLSVSEMLSEEYTTLQLIQNVKARMPEYPNNFEVYSNHSAVHAYWDLNIPETNFALKKTQFKFKYSEDTPLAEIGGLKRYVVFYPVDDILTEDVDESEMVEFVALINWENTSQDYESPLYEIDPGSNVCIKGTGAVLLSSHDFTRSGRYSLLKVDVVPDYDRDGVIREEPWTDGDGKLHPSDYQKTAGDDPFYFWINNDSDDYEGSVHSSNIPNTSNPDASDYSVNGITDLVDFFPLFVDFHGLLDQLDITKVQLEILGAEVNVVELSEEHEGFDQYDADRHHTDVDNSIELRYADTRRSNSGVYLRHETVERIRDGNGLLLFEGRVAGDEPLKLRLSYDGVELVTHEMQLKLSEVEDMYRHIDLRTEATGGTPSSYTPGNRYGEPTGWPEGTDGPANNKQFVFIHGYRVDGEGARGTFAEVFKRMYQSGSNARFTAVTFYGDDSPGNDLWENVIHAFESSKALRDTLEDNAAFSGERTILAHSLGNMVVSSAIADHGLSAAKYFMMDAAVAKEAYDGLLTGGEQSAMRNPDWVHPSEGLYDWRLWASHWHLLFKQGGSPFGASLDERSNLTWRGRFGILPQAYNFYSSTENVLANGDGNNPGVSPAFPWSNGGTLAWVSNEMNKGHPSMVSYSTLDVHAGWGFNRSSLDEFPDGWRTDIGFLETDFVDGHFSTRMLSPSEIAALSLTDEELSEVLRSMPFFRRFQSADADYFSLYKADDLYQPLGSGSLGTSQEEKYLTRAKILAEAIPSLSFAAGRNPIPDFDILSGEIRNFNMSSDFKNGNQWPSDRETSDWWHSDFKDVSYQYVFPLFNKFVELGGLNAE